MIRQMDWKEDHNRWVASLPNDVRDAHARSSNHRDELLRSAVCGCFHCCARFPPSEIEEWIDENDEGVGTTALCPKCGIDSVIGSSSGCPLTPEFLGKMNGVWFQ